MCTNSRRSRAHQKWIGHRMCKTGLRIWSGCVDNSLLNEGLLRSEVSVLKKLRRQT
jgi:hypothetical protein